MFFCSNLCCISFNYIFTNAGSDKPNVNEFINTNIRLFSVFLSCSTIRTPEPFIRNLVHFQTKVRFTYTDSRIKELMDDELLFVYFGYTKDIVDLLEKEYELELMIPIKMKINEINFFHRDLKAFIESKIDWIL